MEHLNKLKEEVYQCAISHGWHEEDLSDEHCLCLVISELMEAVNADRKNSHADVKSFKHAIDNALREEHLSGNEYEIHFSTSFQVYVKDSVEDEIADTVIRIMNFAGMKHAKIDDNLEALGSMKNMSLTVFCYKLCALISDPDKSEKNWVELNISAWIALIKIWCRDHNIDIMWHIKQKMKYNELHPYKHGGKKY